MACPGMLWGVLWFLALFFLGWPLAFFVAWLYVLLLPFAACSPKLKEVCETIHRVVKLPLTFAENMVKMKPCCGKQDGI